MLFGLVAVWLSAKANIISWPVGIINVILSFVLYYQVQLYPDMFLQVFFFITNIIGWWRWGNPGPGEENKKMELKVSYMNKGQLLLTAVTGIIGVAMLGKFASHLHEWLPTIFSIPSSYPYIDSFITIMSVIATFYMIQKKIECWVIWIIIDVVATILYFIKGVKFFSAEYLVFTFLAAFGLITWIQEYKNISHEKISV